MKSQLVIAILSRLFIASTQIIPQQRIIAYKKEKLSTIKLPYLLLIAFRVLY